jgi:hypothetical protein
MNMEHYLNLTKNVLAINNAWVSWCGHNFQNNSYNMLKSLYFFKISLIAMKDIYAKS